MRRTRRGAPRAAVLALALLPAVTGCGTTPSPGTASDKAGQAGYPRTLHNCGHEVTLQHRPQRAVSLDQGSTEIPLALGLDVRHQLELPALVARSPVTSVVALHDLNLAAMLRDHLVALRRGGVVAAGPPGEVLTRELIAQVYGVRSVVTAEGVGGRPAVRFPPEDETEPGETAEEAS
ncbi:hypothetical protein [Streptomyces diacarni]|uniref:hypothetical protein n=1 Tax=Streptomyces diacarni TaxID=2800381 RepID=UPI003F4CAFE1